MDVIITHISADFDSVASMVAAKKLYPQAKIVFPGSQEKNVRDFLRQTGFPLKYETLRRVDLDQVARLIIVNTNNSRRIGEFAEILDKPSLKIHIYDHHPLENKDIEAEKEVIEQVGASTTILVHILKEQELPITPGEATVMALGIYEDTGSLSFQGTTEKDLLAAAYLLSKGADLSVVSDYIRRELTAEQIVLLNELIHASTRVHIEGIDIVLIKATFDQYIGDLAYLIHKYCDMEEVNVLFALVMMENKVHLIARSRIDAVDVGKIARELGGGGHRQAASATLKEVTPIQAEEKLLAVLQQHIQAAHLAKYIMSTPAISIDQNAPLQDAKDLLDRFSVNTLPVLDGGKPEGYITRQIVSRAIFHGLEKERVGDYMITDIYTVKSDTPFSQIELLVSQNPQKIIPVVDDEKIVGIITRSDVFKVLQESTLKKMIATSDREVTHGRSIEKLLEDCLPARAFRLLREIGQIADEKGYSVYIVGGFVRDLLLSKSKGQESGVRSQESKGKDKLLAPGSWLLTPDSLDIDIVVEGNGFLFAEEVINRYGASAKTHAKFGTAVLKFPDGLKLDIATARTEHYEYPAALPTITHSSIKLDLYRRDFTINTLAIKLNSLEFGKVFDFFGGLRDLKDKVIRVLHSLSFVEDPTRVFRAVRFEQRFNFRISPFTLNLLKNAVHKHFLDKLSGKRLFTELLLILQEVNILRIVERMGELDLLKTLHPGLASQGILGGNGKGTLSLLRNIRSVLAWYELLYLPKIDAWLVHLLGIVDPLSLTQLEELIQRLTPPAKALRALRAYKQLYHTIEQKFLGLSGQEVRNSEWYQIFNSIPTEILLFAMAKTKSEEVKKAISLFMTKLKEIKICITGQDLIDLGIRPGPIFHKLLDEVLEARLDGKVETKEEEIEYVKKRMNENIMMNDERGMMN
jgi:tRNA nucleotidyltransferase (CCA-adding enzyme)